MSRVRTRRFCLVYNVSVGRWEFKNEGTERVERIFASKEAATKAGVLEKLVGRDGGSVVIRTKNGVFEEERNYRTRVG